MMEEKIEAAAALPTLRDATDQLHAIGGDLSDVSALVFALSHPNGDFEFDHRTLRAVALTLDSIAKRAIEQGDALHEAHRATMPV